MLSFLHKSLSGESDASPSTGGAEVNHADNLADLQELDKSAKRNLSGGSSDATPNIQRKRKCEDRGKHNPLGRGKNVELKDSSATSDIDNNESTTSDDAPIKKLDLPDGTPDWGIRMLEILQGEFRQMSRQLTNVENRSAENTDQVHTMAQKLAKVEKKNQDLVDENSQLKEKLLDLEYRQRRNNLLFEGIQDSNRESDIECMNKLRRALRGIPGLEEDEFKIERCHRIDGKFNINKTRRIICCFNWYYDVQCILRNRKSLPSGIFVSGDLPEEWLDCCKVLKPIFNAAHKSETLKEKTFLSKDKLIIDGKTYTAHTAIESNAVLDVPGTCQRSDHEKTIFF